MSTMIAVKEAWMRDEFLSILHEHSIPAYPVEGLTKLIEAPTLEPADFPFGDHEYVDSFSDGNQELTPCSDRVFQHTNPRFMDQDLTIGGWGPPRIIRRVSPWRKLRPGGQIPESTFYSRRLGRGVDIYIIDSGVDVQHPEFSGRATQKMYTSSSQVNGTRWDGSGHGTHCLTNAAGDTAGIARMARLHSVKFHTSNSGAGVSNAVSAMGLIRSHHMSKAEDRPSVMFLSWSGFNSTVDAAVAELIDAGVACCFPAGNDATDLGTTTIRPAESDPDGIICGGLSIDDQAYLTIQNDSGTNFGMEVDILAPAQYVVGARRFEDGGGYRLGNGTSYATPFVTGVLACMLEGYSKMTTRTEVQALKAKLLANATAGQLRPRRRKNGTIMTLPDKILYLDPEVEFEVIPGLTPRYQ